MKDLSLIRPSTLEEASKFLKENEGNSKPFAGCTDVMVQFRNREGFPKKLVSLKSISNLDYIKEDKKNVYIGANTILSDISKNNVIKQEFPALSEASSQIGSPLIRNSATMVGNICNASPAADTATPLLVYKAKVRIFNESKDTKKKIFSKSKERIIDLEEFFVGPGKTILQAGDIVVEIIIPKPKKTTVSKFYKQGKRKALEISIVNIAVNLNFDDDDKITDALIACGAVAPIPKLVKETSKYLIGKTIESLEDLDPIAEIIRNEVSPISDIRSTGEYRKHIVGVLVKRIVWDIVESRKSNLAFSTN